MSSHTQTVHDSSAPSPADEQQSSSAVRAAPRTVIQPASVTRKQRRGTRSGASAQKVLAKQVPTHLQQPPFDKNATIVYRTTATEELDRILELQTEQIEREYAVERSRNQVFTDNWSQMNMILGAFSAYEKAIVNRPNLTKMFDVIEFVAYACAVQQLRLACQSDPLGVWPSVPDGFMQSPERYLLNASLPACLVPYIEALRPHNSAEGTLCVYVPYTYNDAVGEHDVDEDMPFDEAHRPKMKNPRIMIKGEIQEVPEGKRVFRPCFVELLRLRDTAIAGKKHTLSAKQINDTLGFEVTSHSWQLNAFSDSLESAGVVRGSTPFGYLFRISALIPCAFEGAPLACNFFRRLWATMKDPPAVTELESPGTVIRSSRVGVYSSIVSPIVLPVGTDAKQYSVWLMEKGLDPTPALVKWARVELAEIGAVFAHVGDTGPILREFLRRSAGVPDP